MRDPDGMRRRMIASGQPAEDLKADKGQDLCTCGGHLTAKPDEQYGTIWTCDECGQRYADEGH